MQNQPQKPRVLLVDDDEDIRSQMKWALQEDYQLSMAEDGRSAVSAFRQHRPLVTLLDLGLPPRPTEPDEGLAVLSEILALDRFAKVIVISGQAEKTNTLQAMRRGALDFLSKPVDMQELKVILKRGVYVAQMEQESRKVTSSAEAETSFEGMLGSSPQMQQVFNSIRKVASTDAPVLILGSSGTGKEMAAQAIHRNSARKEGPFVAINCGAIPENLLETELFGHEKGSFTGAHAQRKGRIETANGGTLFLDEVGELPLNLQVKLLRFLQEQTIERVGGRAHIQIDTRVVAATNVDLKNALTDGKFREDLYYRLAVVVIRLPSLAERSSDIIVLARSFLQRFCAQTGREVADFSPQSVSSLQQHLWPGNVRELENRVRRAVIMAEGRFINPPDLELAVSAGVEPAKGLKEAREEVEREMVLQALQRHGGKITSAAQELGISRPTFYELMEKLGIQKAARPGE